MSLKELTGIVDAIESESMNPAPSHANLARLVAKGLRIIENSFIPDVEEQKETITETLNATAIAVEAAAVKPAKRKRSSK